MGLGTVRAHARGTLDNEANSDPLTSSAYVSGGWHPTLRKGATPPRLNPGLSSLKRPTGISFLIPTLGKEISLDLITVDVKSQTAHESLGRESLHFGGSLGTARMSSSCHPLSGVPTWFRVEFQAHSPAIQQWGSKGGMV